LISSEAEASRVRRGRSVVIAAIAIAAITPLLVLAVVLTRDTPVTQRFIITEGTRAALAAGNVPENALPSSLSLNVGDTLEITNNDTEAHTYAFIVLRPGETSRHTFRQAGVFIGACTVNDHEEVTITVT
jgi:plastocyanin